MSATRHVRTINADSTLEAEDKRRSIAKDIEERLAALEMKPDRSKTSDIAAEWLNKKMSARRPDGTSRLAPTTIDRYKVTVNKWVVPVIGHYYIDELTQHVVRDWRDYLGERMAAATVNGHLRTLRTLLADNGIDVAKRVQPLEEDDTRITDDDPNLLNQEELKRFLEIAREKQARHYPLILFLLTTGCRISTARAVRWEDLDPKLGVVHLRRRLSKNETISGVKRSRVSKDVAPLLPELHRLLEQQRRGFSNEQSASGLVFPSSRSGGPVARSVLDKPIAAIMKEARIAKRFTPHSFRRTAALAYRLASSSALAQAVLGHQTERMHMHYAPEQSSERVAAAERAFGGLIGHCTEESAVH